MPNAADIHTAFNRSQAELVKLAHMVDEIGNGDFADRVRVLLTELGSLHHDYVESQD